MNITDEMIEVFGDEWQAAREFEEALGNDRRFVPSGYKRKRGLEAVLPLIEAEIAKEIGRLNGHLGSVQEILDNDDGTYIDSEELIDVMNAWREGES